MRLGKIKTIVIMSMLAFSTTSFSFEKVIYGEDDRLDVFETTNSLYLDLGRSTAAMISKSKLELNQDEYKVIGESLGSRGICTDARFANQITSARCSGFLVGKDLLVTAGHCMTSENDCSSNSWVFDFAVNTPDDEESVNVPTSSVYSCKKIIAQSLDRYSKDDYALIQLDREVEDREPLTFRTEGTVESGTNLVVIGHPTGLPTKIAAGAYVRSNDNDIYFVANLDTFGGNSGSAVFDSETGLVEGILVRGERDYEYDFSRGCRVPKQCSNDGCRGEDVTRITNIKELLENL